VRRPAPPLDSGPRHGKEPGTGFGRDRPGHTADGQGEFGIQLKLTLQFGSLPPQHLTVDFQGDWDRYKRLKQVTDAFAREPDSQIHVDLTLVVNPGGTSPW